MGRSQTFDSRLIKEDLFHKAVSEYVEHMMDKQSIIIWGTGRSGQMLYRLLEKFDVTDKVKYFSDNDRNKWQQKLYGLTILSPEKLVQYTTATTDVSIIIASEFVASIEQQLLSLGIAKSQLDTRGHSLTKDYFTFQEATPFEIIHSHYESFEKVYSYLEDAHSKDLYISLLNSKIALDNKFLRGLSSPSEDQYFEQGLIKLGEHEVFCDCGSFNGDTLRTFANLTRRKYNKYIAIEADKQNYADLLQNIEDYKYDHVQTYNVACWHERTTLSFQPELTAGRVTSEGLIQVQADALDNMLEDEEVTFIKMDIEGAEEMALKGAKKTIQRHKPVLAICIYHDLEDYYKLPLYIKELDPDYRLYIRHYKDMVDVETVCYAIPID